MDRLIMRLSLVLLSLALLLHARCYADDAIAVPDDSAGDKVYEKLLLSFKKDYPALARGFAALEQPAAATTKPPIASSVLHIVGDAAFPVALGNPTSPHGEQPMAVVAAARLKKGRVVVFGSNSLLTGGGAPALRVARDAITWAAGKRAASTLPVAALSNEYASLLAVLAAEGGISAAAAGTGPAGVLPVEQFLSTKASKRPAVYVLDCTCGFSEAQVSGLVAWVEAGGGLVVAGHARPAPGAPPAAAEGTDPEDLALNRLLVTVGIVASKDWQLGFRAPALDRDGGVAADPLLLMYNLRAARDVVTPATDTTEPLSLPDDSRSAVVQAVNWLMHDLRNDAELGAHIADLVSLAGMLSSSNLFNGITEEFNATDLPAANALLTAPASTNDTLAHLGSNRRALGWAWIGWLADVSSVGSFLTGVLGRGDGWHIRPIDDDIACLDISTTTRGWGWTISEGGLSYQAGCWWGSCAYEVKTWRCHSESNQKWRLSAGKLWAPTTFWQCWSAVRCLDAPYITERRLTWACALDCWGGAGQEMYPRPENWVMGTGEPTFTIRPRRAEHMCLTYGGTYGHVYFRPCANWRSQLWFIPGELLAPSG